MTTTADHRHPIPRVVAGICADLGSVADAPVWSLDTDATISASEQVQVAKSRLAELEARLLVQADAVAVAATDGATSTANWLAHRTRLNRATCHRLVRFAHALAAHPPNRAALAAGAIHAEQAAAILSGLVKLPTDFDPAQVTTCETHLVEQAGTFDAKGLQRLSYRAVEVISPETVDAHHAALLARQERDAARATTLFMWDDGEGRCHGRFTIDTLTGAILRTMLHAITAPRHQRHNAEQPSPECTRDRRTYPERLGAAFAELIARYPAETLPQAGGLNATIVVTMPYDTLTGGLAAASLDTGDTISPGAARMLACEAGIIPAVLGGHCEVLDLGRTRRFHNRAQRMAAQIEQRTCIAEGCDWPPGMCHLHQPDPLVPGRTHQPRRPTPLPAPPRAGPRPGVPDDQTRRQQDRLPPTDPVSCA